MLPFHHPTVLLSAQASLAAYSETPFFFSPHCHGYVLETADTLHIAFRGTKNIWDWITDVRVWMHNDKTRFSGNVHAGFDDSVGSVADDVAKLVQSAKDKGKRVVFCGHSLGGAQAVLAAFLFGNIVPDYQVVTFGQPRVGNSAFAKAATEKFGDRHWRFIHEEDIVARLAPLVLGYRHSGKVGFFPSTGGFLPNPPLWLMALSDAYGLYKDYRKTKVIGLDLVADHAMSQYVTCIQSLAA